MNQDEKTITVNAHDKVTAEKLMASLIYEDGVTVDLKRGSGHLNGSVRVTDKDTVVASYNDSSLAYSIKLAAGEENDVIPVEDMIASAAAAETVQSNDKVENVIDGNVGTMWHTPWNGNLAAEDKYLTIELKNDYKVSGYIYTPRSDAGSGALNGIITKYEIYTSDDNINWQKVSEGDWAKDASVKTAAFEPVQAKYVKLLAVESHGGYVSAAEVRLKGERVYSDTEAPSAPAVTQGDVSRSTAVIHWEKSEDNVGVTEYHLMNGETVIATFDAGEDVYSYGVADLAEDTEYTFSVVAVDEAGNVSEAGSVTIRTESGKEDIPEPDKSELQKTYDEYAAIKNEDYTEESWKKFEEALSAARGVLENENASQEEVHTALETLTKAKEALVLKEDKDPDDNTGNTDKPGSGKNPSNVNKPGTAGTGKNVNKTNKTVSKNPSTGDHAYVAFYLMLIGAAGVVITFAVRKKTR